MDRYGSDSADDANAVAVSPNGKSVFVAGSTWRDQSHSDITTIAYSVATGKRLWIGRYDHGNDYAHDIAVSPDGSRVFVTGWSSASGTGFDYVTVAFAAATGKQLWASRYHGPPEQGHDEAYAIVATKTKVFVTGQSNGGASSIDAVTIAYDAARGTELWVDRYDGSEGGEDGAYALAASPDESKVFVVGFTQVGNIFQTEFFAIAYSASSGNIEWARTYGGSHGGDGSAASVAVDHTGKFVVVVGDSPTADGQSDFATISYAANGGRVLWIRRYDGPAHRADGAGAVVINSASTRVFVAGASAGANNFSDFATIAYRLRGGGRVWLRRYDDPGHGSDGPTSMAISRDGQAIFITGSAPPDNSTNMDYETISYGAAGGKLRWARRFTAPGAYQDLAFSIAVTPNGRTVFVTGRSYRRSTYEDLVTIAYRA